MAIAILSATLIASTVFVPSTFAEGSEPLPYLIKDLFAATPEYWTDSALNNTYWVDVEKKEITDGLDGKTYYGVFPKYLTSPSKTAIADFPFNSLDGMTSTPNAGIVNSFNTYWFLPGMNFEERYGYLAGNDTAEGDTKPGQHPTKPIENRVNPFGFGENDLLTQDEIKNPVDKLKVYGDLRLKDVTDSKAVGELQPGDKLNLDFSVNISWFKRYLNGWTLNYTRLGGMKDAEIDKFHNSYGKVDAGFTFTLDIPDGVEVANDASATISGIKGFSPSVTKTKDGKTLIVTLKKDNPGTTQKWQDIINEVKNVDTSNIMISVTGLSVKKTATQGKKYRIRGTVSGFYDFANSLTENFVKATTAREDDRANRSYFFFAAEQDASGLDNNGEENKPKQISYSFQVKKPTPTQNTVTFINGDEEYAKVKVENGKSISGDALYTESMPKNPAKAGYTFKEWNTQADGKGTTFTGKTTVNRDMTVYAIYTKDYVPTPTPTPTPTQNTVTFINGDKEYAKVKVENGKSISGDALDTESMPKDPTKAGYVFKEWNTSADGKGTAFTGDTIVNKDMKVYAIYDKKTVKPEPKKPAKPEPKNPAKPEPKKPVKPEPQKPVVKVKVPQTGDSSNIGIFTGLLGLSGGALAVLIALRKRKMREEN